MKSQSSNTKYIQHTNKKSVQILGRLFFSCYKYGMDGKIIISSSSLKFGFFRRKIKIMEIEVVDTPFTDALYKSYTKSRDFRFTQVSRIKHTDDITEGHRLYKSALHHYKAFLEVIGKEDHYNPPEVWDETNKWLNIMHRCFTRAWQLHYAGERYDHNLFDECRQHLQQLNADIHDCEFYVETDRMVKHDCWWLEVEGLNDNTTLIDLKDVEYEISNDYDVTVMPYTLGKNFKIAYLDNDIVAEDVHNIDKKTYFSLKIDSERKIRNMFESPNFAAWKKENNYDGPIGGIPIGNISKRYIKPDRLWFLNGPVNIDWLT